LLAALGSGGALARETPDFARGNARPEQFATKATPDFKQGHISPSYGAKSGFFRDFAVNDWRLVVTWRTRR
jgi:hypothetical protein